MNPENKQLAEAFHARLSHLQAGRDQAGLEDLLELVEAWLAATHDSLTHARAHNQPLFWDDSPELPFD